MNADPVLKNPTPPTFAGQVTNITELKQVTTNISNSEVVVNVPFQNKDNVLERMIAIQNFTKNYYQLIVTTDAIGFSQNRISVRPDQALIHDCVPPKIFEQCSTLSPQGIKELKSFPALICMKSSDDSEKPDTKQQAIYGYLKEIWKSEDFIMIECGAISAFPLALLRENADAFGLCMDCARSDLNWCMWSVRNINLFEAFDKAGLSSLPRPDMYQ